jgi:hypothetical protein
MTRSCLPLTQSEISGRTLGPGLKNSRESGLNRYAGQNWNGSGRCDRAVEEARTIEAHAKGSRFVQSISKETG